MPTHRHYRRDGRGKGCVRAAHAFVGRLRQRCTTFVNKVYFEGLEECLVEGALGLICADLIDRGGVLQCRQHSLESFEEHQSVIFRRADKAQRIRDLPLNLQLSGLDVLGGKRVIEVSVDELLLLAFQLFEALALLGEEDLAGFEVLVDRADGGGACLSDLIVAEPALGLPLLQYGVFDLLNGHVGKIAACSSGVATEAEEVLVHSAATAGFSVPYTPAAPPAYE